MTHLRIGYSTCPNDTFIFAGLPALGGVSPVTFDPILADVETLNGWAMEKRLELSKLSFFAFGKVREHYALLHAGAALGRGCGPVIVARSETSLRELASGSGGRPRKPHNSQTSLDALSRKRAPIQADDFFRGHACRA